MTSRNNPITSSQGSALIVTILLVSVLLGAALILLQRIIPYAKSVRSMHDASQAYYVARGQVDLARLNFLYSSGQPIVLRIPSFFGLLSADTLNNTTITIKNKRDDIATGRTNPSNGDISGQVVGEVETSPGSGIKNISIALPFVNLTTHNALTNIPAAYTISSKSSQNPLKIKLFSTDTTVVKFGTSKSNNAYHTLNPKNAGGLRFDFRGVKTNDPARPFALILQFSALNLPNKTITLKMQYFSGASTDPVKTFTEEYALTDNGDLNLTTNGGIGNIQLIEPGGTVDSPPGTTFGDFILNNDCSAATICSLSFILSGTNSPVDFQLVSSTGSSNSIPIPDLNAVVIGDGLSKNNLYYQRIINLIPTPQDI